MMNVCAYDDCIIMHMMRVTSLDIQVSLLNQMASLKTLGMFIRHDNFKVNLTTIPQIPSP